ncbi:MAG: FtsX-like permease family protein, partial [Mucilaginibacter sp.]
TEKTALKYFNKTNAVGETFTFNSKDLYKVTAVIKDIPKQSHFNYDFFIAMPGLDESKEDAWFSEDFNTYILLKPGADANKLSGKLTDFFRRHAGPQLASVLHLTFDKFEQSGNYIKLYLFPLKKIHLESNIGSELGANGNIQYIYIFSLVAIFILLIACVNFMNLSTARSSNRAREVGVRKVLGSPRKYLVAQFLTESIMITLVATVIAVLTAWALLPLFNQMAGKELEITGQILRWLLPVLLFIVIVIGCLAGSYPALYLSAFQPIKVLKGTIAAGFKGGVLRSVLVVFQFAISIFLIIGTLVIYNQLKFIQSKDLGYSRDHVLVINNVWALGNGAKTFKQEVKRLSGVQDVSLSGALPTGGTRNATSFFKDRVLDQKRAVTSQEWVIDEDYIKTLKITMVSGRNFSADMRTDTAGLIINEAAAKLLNYKDPLNQTLYTPADNMVTKMAEFHIIGVMKDFNFKSLRDNVTPLVFLYGEDRGALSIRLKSTNIPLLINQVKAKYKELSPNQQFSYSFMDDDFDALYRSEQRVGVIFITFTSLAIIIACLGLFGLAAYAAEQRTKEIGIRKVLGASVSAIVGMLSKDFILLVFISIAIATPLAWWAMHNWLQGFAYRQNIQWWVVALAGVTALAIAIITISFQSVKAALTNPVKSLKRE